MKQRRTKRRYTKKSRVKNMRRSTRRSNRRSARRSTRRSNRRSYRRSYRRSNRRSYRRSNRRSNRKMLKGGWWWNDFLENRRNKKKEKKLNDYISLVAKALKGSMKTYDSDRDILFKDIALTQAGRDSGYNLEQIQNIVNAIRRTSKDSTLPSTIDGKVKNYIKHDPIEQDSEAVYFNMEPIEEKIKRFELYESQLVEAIKNADYPPEVSTSPSDNQDTITPSENLEPTTPSENPEPTKPSENQDTTTPPENPEPTPE